MLKSTAYAPTFFAPISASIWAQKYRLTQHDEHDDLTLGDTFWRVARAAASVEAGQGRARDSWAEAFYQVMADFSFLPGGRILAGAGSNRNVTLFNCFVLGRIDDDLGAIFSSVREAALTLQAGGGIGHDFSTLRPRNAPVQGVGGTASGPVSFMEVWDAMCATMMSAGQRRGAMMGTLRCDHPDIMDFIEAKADPRRLRNFNLSVLVTDAFVAAIKADASWDLVFDGVVYGSVSARSLWDKIARSNYDFAEPGVIFIDRVNASNNLSYCETISTTNPCGEQPLPPYGACLLGSINLARFIDAPFTREADLDRKRLAATVKTAVRLLDNLIDVSRYPLPAQEHEARTKRRMGLGVTGLADALIFLGLGYGSAAARERASMWMAVIQDAAYQASAELAAEKGAFPAYDREAFGRAPNVRRLAAATQDLIAKHGVRNGCLTTIAPTGTISLLAGNVSSGIEPVFDFRYHRRVRTAEGLDHQEIVEDFAYAQYQRLNEGDRPSGPEWINAAGLTPLDHLAMQAALQPHVDSAISKTINCPADIDPKAFEDLYMTAYDLGLKGCTLFRPNAVTGAVLSAIPASIVPETGAAGPENEAKAPDASEVCPRCLQSKQRTRQRLGQCETCLECGTSSCE
jgi:ribonucleoside-diphosphate reductase alpha chain